jgi:hypothetical protein
MDLLALGLKVVPHPDRGGALAGLVQQDPSWAVAIGDHRRGRVRRGAGDVDDVALGPDVVQAVLVGPLPRLPLLLGDGLLGLLLGVVVVGVEQIFADVAVATRPSKAPMSQRGPTGRSTPRWSSSE